MHLGLGYEKKPIALMAHARLLADQRAQFAMSCIERWGMVAADADGEDSAGRSKLRRLTSEEVVSHACECADKAYAEFRNRGWLVDIPSYQSLVDAMKDKENGND